MSLDEIEGRISAFGQRHILITGGEPLEQKSAPVLAERLVQKGYVVLIETGGLPPTERASTGTGLHPGCQNPIFRDGAQELSV